MAAFTHIFDIHQRVQYGSIIMQEHVMRCAQIEYNDSELTNIVLSIAPNLSPKPARLVSKTNTTRFYLGTDSDYRFEMEYNPDNGLMQRLSVFREDTGTEYRYLNEPNKLDAEQYISYLIKNVRVHMGDFDWYAKNAIKPTLTNADPHLAEGPLYCTCGCNAIINRFNDCAPFLQVHIQQSMKWRYDLMLNKLSYESVIKKIANLTLDQVKADNDPIYFYNSVAWYMALVVFDYCLSEPSEQKKYAQVFLDAWKYYYTHF